MLGVHAAVRSCTYIFPYRRRTICASCHIIALDASQDLSNINVWKQVCKRRGWEFREGQTRYQWVNAWFDDSPVPRALFQDEAEYQRVVSMSKYDRVMYMQGFLGHCEHVIHLPGHDCEVGLVRVGGNLLPVWDWASSLPTILGWPYDEGWRDPLLAEYITSKVELQAQALGYAYTVTYQPATKQYEVEVQI